MALANSESTDQNQSQDINSKPKKLCSGLRYDLKKCLLATDCVKIVSFSLENK